MTNSPPPQRRRRRRKRGRLPTVLLILVLLIIGGWFWLQWECWGLETTYAETTLDRLPSSFDGLRIVHLSDLHGHEYGENSRDLLLRVAEAEPDLIFLTGDMIDQTTQLEAMRPLAKGLMAIAPTYYVTGNHEWALHSGTVKQLKALYEEYGIRVLSNEAELLQRGEDAIVLAGVDDPNGYADQKTPETLAKDIRNQYGDVFTILLAHRNDRFEQYAAAGYDLVFSGHGHGGIVRLPGTDGLVSTSLDLFPTYTSGFYTYGNSTLFASRGLGNNTVPIKGFRIFNRPEVCVVTLHAKG